MRLSIIIPVYNVEHYVGKTLSSVFDTKASTDDFEVIVINDGTKDKSMDVVRRFSDRSNLTILEQENRGLSAARMRGVSIASGDFVWFIDSDDYLVEDGVGKVLALLAETPEVDLLMFPLLWTYDDETADRLDYSVDGEGVFSGKSLIKDSGLPLWAIQRFVFRRSLTENKSLFFPEGYLREDEYFAPVLVYLSQRVRVMPEPVYFYRIRTGSIINSQTPRLSFDMVSIYQFMIRFLDRIVDPDDRAWFQSYCFKRLHSVYTKASVLGITPDFCRFAQSKGFYVWRQWLRVHPGATLKNKLGRLFYYLFPGFRQRLLNRWHTIKGSLKNLIRWFLRHLPVKRNRVVFLNFLGKGYGDNAKFIAEEILRRKLRCDLVWLVDGDAYVPDGIKRAERKGLSGLYALSTAGVIINNCKVNFPGDFRKKKKQFYLQTWHGDFALKFIEKEVEDSLPPFYVRKSKADSEMTDAVVSGSQSFSKILKESFWYSERCSILEFGVPRNDIYFRGNNYREELKRSYGFSSGVRILLYAPTFRDHGETDCYNLDFESLRLTLERTTGEEWKVIVRLHPNISDKDGMFCYGENVLNGSVYPDQQELSMISDCLITDYSSIMGDFLLMAKPVFLYVPDLEMYSSKSEGRGLRELYYQLPLPRCDTQHELEVRITLFDRNRYDSEVDSFMKECYHPFDDGHASERIVDYLKPIMHLH